VGHSGRSQVTRLGLVSVSIDVGRHNINCGCRSLLSVDLFRTGVATHSNSSAIHYEWLPLGSDSSIRKGCGLDDGFLSCPSSIFL